MIKCPICASPARIHGNSKDFDNYSDYDIDCLRCGKFNIIMWKYVYNMEMFIELKEIKQISKEQIANISGWIRENQGSDIVLTEEKFKLLKNLQTLTVSEKADRILKYLARQFPVAGMKIKTPLNDFGKVMIKDENGKQFFHISNDLLPILGIGYIVNNEELIFIWRKYLISTKKFITIGTPKTITPEGWSYLESLRQANPESKKAFVAMWFDDEMTEICEKFIKKAAEDAGDYKAEPINDKDYNGDINDAIIGEIRNSKFIIADFTGNRGGVYYEAGFAHGLNIPVIYTCREDWFNQFVMQSIKIKTSKGNEDDKEFNIYSQIHFDINHHNFIIWKDGKDLYEQLVKRIKATIT